MMDLSYVSASCNEARRLLDEGVAVSDLPLDIREVFFDVELIKLRSGMEIHPALMRPTPPPPPRPSCDVISLADRRERRSRGLPNHGGLPPCA